MLKEKIARRYCWRGLAFQRSNEIKRSLKASKITNLKSHFSMETIETLLVQYDQQLEIIEKLHPMEWITMVFDSNGWLIDYKCGL